jgi:uncharacterized protein YodC (DUF2158 family)
MKCVMDILRSFAEGQLVRQKCGGPVMWVISIDEGYPVFPSDQAPPGGVCCGWEEDSILFEHVFSPYGLDIISGQLPRLVQVERRSSIRSEVAPPPK